MRHLKKYHESFKERLFNINQNDFDKIEDMYLEWSDRRSVTEGPVVFYGEYFKNNDSAFLSFDFRWVTDSKIDPNGVCAIKVVIYPLTDSGPFEFQPASSLPPRHPRSVGTNFGGNILVIKTHQIDELGLPHNQDEIKTRIDITPETISAVFRGEMSGIVGKYIKALDKYGLNDKLADDIRAIYMRSKSLERYGFELEMQLFVRIYPHINDTKIDITAELIIEKKKQV